MAGYPNVGRFEGGCHVGVGGDTLKYSERSEC